MGEPSVVYFVDTWTNHYLPQVGRAAVKVLEAMGYNVIVPATVCCGRPMISQGLLGEARLLAEHNIEVLAPFAERGTAVVVTEPSCVSAMLDEWPQLVRSHQARRVAARVQPVESFVARALRGDPGRFAFARRGVGKLLLHGHCHQKALIGTGEAMELLKACSHGEVSEVDAGCCGMAGAFGYETEHYDVARAIGEQRLFPAVRRRGEASVATSGFSCRQQLQHHTGVCARHVIEFVAEALA